MTRSILDDAFGHHVWATLRLLDACAHLTEGELETTVPGTYGSIIDTLRHLVESDCSYLALLSDGRVSDIHETQLDVAGLRAAMEPNGEVWAAVVAAAGDPDVEVVRHRDDGTDSIAPLGIRLSQVVHHGTDHRSQVCTALTSIGVEPPGIDVWDYAEQAGRRQEVQRVS